ncbi:MAG: small multi-drug export protein, partial [Kiritimatiellaeota bacterium]|nr:small multi-drug export protein [Kiritimatiellota bacterium]
LAEVLPSVLAAHLTTGRAGGITTALSVGFSRLQAIALGSLIEGAVVCLFFPIFSLSFKRLIRLPFLDETLDRMHRSAEAQRQRVLHWGVPGLLAFVWFPFFMTGPLVGSVIGFLLGMRPAVVVGVVLSGTILAIVSWTYALGHVIEWARRIGEVLPLMVVLILVLLVAAYRLRQMAAAAHRRDEAGTEDRDGRT